MQLSVLVYPDENGGYWARVPELPGCNSQGATLDEVEKNILEAIETSLEYASEEETLKLLVSRHWNLEVPTPSVLATAMPLEQTRIA